MRRARGAQLGALMTIIDALETSRLGVTLRELAERTGLHQRSVRRYLEELDDRMAVESVVSGGQRRWRRSSAKKGNKTLSLSLAECMALVRVRSLAMQEWRAAPWLESLKRAFERVEASLPPEMLPLFDATTLVNATARDYPSNASSQALHADFEDAARNHRVLAIRYNAISSGLDVRKYDPYMVYVSEGTTYAYGHDHKSGERRVLALDRVVATLATGESFEPPKDFSAATFVAELHHGYKRVTPQDIVIQVRGRGARLWQDRPEAPDQSVEQLASGALRVHFTAPMTPALIARLLSFGADIEVESPAPLRDAITEQLRLAVKNYGTNPTQRRKPIRVDRRTKRRASRG